MRGRDVLEPARSSLAPEPLGAAVGCTQDRVGTGCQVLIVHRLDDDE
jgi:hypothetical protein